MVTPYCDFLPTPPLSPQRVWRHYDGRFGTNDWICWPQVFTEDFCHFTCIPRFQQSTCLAIMWWDAAPEDLIPEASSSLNAARDFGKLDCETAAKFAFLVDELLA